MQKQGVVVQNVLHRDAVKDGELVRQLPAGSKALMVTPCWLKIVPEWLNKGAALTKVMRECGIRPEEAAAFGNGENDLGMLKSVTHGYAMGSKNSPGEIPVRKTPQRPARSAFQWTERCAAFPDKECRTADCKGREAASFEPLRPPQRGEKQIFRNFYPPLDNAMDSLYTMHCEQRSC